MLETFSQRLEWICRKIWILLQAVLLLLLELIPTFILQKSTSPVAQWAAGLSSIGILVFMCWLAERKGLAIWDRQFLTWNGLGLVALTVLFTSLSTVLGHTIMDLQGIEATANQIGIEKLLLPACLLLEFWSLCVGWQKGKGLLFGIENFLLGRDLDWLH